MKDNRIGGFLCRKVLPTAVLVLAISVLLIRSLSVSMEQEKKKVRDNLEAQALVVGQQIDKTFRSAEKAVEVIAKYLEYDNAGDVDKVMQAFLDTTGLEDIFIYDMDGTGYRAGGEELTEEEMTRYANAAEINRESKQNGNIYAGSDSFYAAAPIEKEGAATGYAICAYDRNLIAGQNITKNFGGNAFYLILDKNGKVVYLDEKAQAKENPFCVASDDYIKTLRTLTDDSFQTEVLKSQMKNNQMCTKAYTYGDYSYTLFEVPVLDGDYFLIIGAEQTYVNEQVHIGWRPLYSIALQIMAVLLVFIVVLTIIDVVEKNHENEKKKALEDKADTDLLTTLNNKIATERKIKEHLAAHPDEMAVMFVVDIDNFKKINDTMGHAFGDEVLKTLGKHICGEFRASDIIGRTGGDEFMVFLCNMKEDAIIKKEAKRLEKFFQSFQAGSYVKYSATASIGAAVYPRDAQTFEGLYRAADQAMYVAKKKGKNRLAFYGEESTEP